MFLFLVLSVLVVCCTGCFQSNYSVSVVYNGAQVSVTTNSPPDQFSRLFYFSDVLVLSNSPVLYFYNKTKHHNIDVNSRALYCPGHFLAIRTTSTAMFSATCSLYIRSFICTMDSFYRNVSKPTVEFIEISIVANGIGIATTSSNVFRFATFFGHEIVLHNEDYGPYNHTFSPRILYSGNATLVHSDSFTLVRYGGYYYGGFECEPGVVTTMFCTLRHVNSGFVFNTHCYIYLLCLFLYFI